MGDVTKLRPKYECDWSKGLDFAEFPELDIALSRYDDQPFETGPSARVQLHKMADRIREYYERRLSEVERERDAETSDRLASALIYEEQLHAAQQENARLREALETAIEKLDEDAQWSGHRNVACHCHPKYALSCPSCGALAPDHVQLSHFARSPSGEHEDGCEFVGMMNELRAALADEKGRDDGD